MKKHIIEQKHTNCFWSRHKISWWNG